MTPGPNISVTAVARLSPGVYDAESTNRDGEPQGRKRIGRSPSRCPLRAASLLGDYTMLKSGMRLTRD